MVKSRKRNPLALANQFLTMDLIVRPNIPDPSDDLVHYVREQMFQLLEDLPNPLTMDRVRIDYCIISLKLWNQTPFLPLQPVSGWIFRLAGSNKEFELTRQFTEGPLNFWTIRLMHGSFWYSPEDFTDDQYSAEMNIFDELIEKGWTPMDETNTQWQPPDRLMIDTHYEIG